MASSSPRIYTSALPPVALTHTSLFTRLFGPRTSSGLDIGGFAPTAPAHIDAVTGTTLSRAQTRDFALTFAHGLRNHPTTAPYSKRGQTVMFFAPNALASPVLLFGCIAAGLRCTLANSAYTPRELAHQYSDSGAALIITTPDGLAVVRSMFADVNIDEQEGLARVVVFEPQDLRWAGGRASPARCRTGTVMFEELLGMGKLDSEERFDGRDAHETVYLCYSSGTTGKAKGVETSHHNLTVVIDIMAHIYPALPAERNRALGILPFYHIYGAGVLLLQPFSLGWPLLIQAQFDPAQFCSMIERYRVSFAYLVPPMLVVLAGHPAVDQYDLSSLEYMLCGGAPLGAQLIKQVKTRLTSQRAPGARCLISQSSFLSLVCTNMFPAELDSAVYGSTETSTGVTILDLADADRKAGSVGSLVPNLEVRLVVCVSVDGAGASSTANLDAEPGQPGELWVRGPTIMKGYLRNARATEEALTPDGWFKTGDVLTRDEEGFFFVVDRVKELIKYKAFQVPPAELEAVLLTHPDIADAAVIGVESVEQATELPRAYIVHARPHELKSPSAKEAFSASVREWIKSHVAKHKYLRGGVVLVDAVPKSTSGKILRRELRELAKSDSANGKVQTKL